MITVRFPNGHTIRYRAECLQHGNNETWILREKKDGNEVAFIQASSGAIVEFDDARSVHNPIYHNEQTARDIRSMKRELNTLRKAVQQLTNIQ